MIGFGAKEHFIQPPTRYEPLESCHQTKVWIPLRILDRFNLAREFVYCGERLTFASDE